MKKVSLLLLFYFALFFTLLSFPNKAFAIENPLNSPNNKVGIHILFPEEIDQAANLVNSNQGDWGYVTVPIQAGDRDLKKWQKFMDDAKKAHIIPIIRLATEGDYFNTKVWRKPNFSDILDFANFLNSLDWPINNRYIIVFNEVNRGDEWGGSPNPKEYAEILNYAVTILKSKSHDFFILSSGFDNASINIPGISLNEYDFILQMNSAVPGIFYQIDGFSSHSYPNPGFSKPSYILDDQSIATFTFEKQFMGDIANKDLPVFITETGWSQEKVTDENAADYYKEAFENVWNNKNIVAITPFLLRADTKPFLYFSFIKNGEKTSQYKALEDLKKEKGSPVLSNGPLKNVFGKKLEDKKTLPVRSYVEKVDKTKESPENIILKNVLKWLFGL